MGVTTLVNQHFKDETSHSFEWAIGDRQCLGLWFDMKQLFSNPIWRIVYILDRKNGSFQNQPDCLPLFFLLYWSVIANSVLMRHAVYTSLTVLPPLSFTDQHIDFIKFSYWHDPIDLKAFMKSKEILSSGMYDYHNSWNSKWFCIHIYRYFGYLIWFSESLVILVVLHGIQICVVT